MKQLKTMESITKERLSRTLKNLDKSLLFKIRSQNATVPLIRYWINHFSLQGVFWCFFLEIAHLSYIVHSANTIKPITYICAVSPTQPQKTFQEKNYDSYKSKLNTTNLKLCRIATGIPAIFREKKFKDDDKYLTDNDKNNGWERKGTTALHLDMYYNRINDNKQWERTSFSLNVTII